MAAICFIHVLFIRSSGGYFRFERYQNILLDGIIVPRFVLSRRHLSLIMVSPLPNSESLWISIHFGSRLPMKSNT